jgi:transposase
LLGVVQTADGMPIYHEVFDGNTAEAPTLEPTLKSRPCRICNPLFHNDFRVNSDV